MVLGVFVDPELISLTNCSLCEPNEFVFDESQNHPYRYGTATGRTLAYIVNVDAPRHSKTSEKSSCGWKCNTAPSVFVVRDSNLACFDETPPPL